MPLISMLIFATCHATPLIAVILIRHFRHAILFRHISVRAYAAIDAFA